MSVVVLRAFSPVFDVESFLQGFPNIDTDVVWRRGEKERSQVLEDSGFSMTLADAETSAEALSMARQELEALTPMLDGLRRQAVFCLVDISVFVGSERQFTNGVELSPGDLAWFAERGLGFAVSAYPVSDEEEEEDA